MLLLAAMNTPPVNGKNALGLGVNATGLALGVLFFGVYFGSSMLTRRFIMERTDDPQPAKYFRDLKIVKDAPER